MQKQYGQSPESKLASTVKKMIQIIYSESRINRYVLCHRVGITPKQYERVGPYLREAFSEMVAYDAQSKDWIYVGPREEEAQQTGEESTNEIQ